MKTYIILGLGFFLSIACYAQKLTLEPVINLRQTNSQSNLISVADTVFAFQDNKAYKGVTFGLKLNYSVSQRIFLSTGIEYERAGTSFGVINDDTCQFCPEYKGGGAYSYRFMLPQQVQYRLFKSGGWSLYGIAGLVPVLSFEKKQPKVVGGNRHFSAGVAEVLNALPTTIKPVYLDYTVGVKAKYRRLNLYYQYQGNLSRSTSNALEVYGQSYNFTQHTKSSVFSVGYDLFRWFKEPD